MKTMKKLVTVLLGIALVFSFAGAGAAAFIEGTDLEQINPPTEVPVTYNLDSLNYYEILIPEAISLYDSEDDLSPPADVSVSLYDKFPSTHLVNISISQPENDESWFVEGTENQSQLNFMLKSYAVLGMEDDGVTYIKEFIKDLHDNSDALNIMSVGKDSVGGSTGHNHVLLYGIISGTPTELNYEGSLTFTVDVADKPVTE